MEIRKEALCALGKLTGLQIGIFRRRFYEPNSCISLYLERRQILHSDISSLCLEIS